MSESLVVNTHFAITAATAATAADATLYYYYYYYCYCYYYYYYYLNDEALQKLLLQSQEKLKALLRVPKENVEGSCDELVSR